jgi:hypothetical protein
MECIGWDEDTEGNAAQLKIKKFYLNYRSARKARDFLEECRIDETNTGGRYRCEERREEVESPRFRFYFRRWFRRFVHIMNFLVVEEEKVLITIDVEIYLTAMSPPNWHVTDKLAKSSEYLVKYAWKFAKTLKDAKGCIPILREYSANLEEWKIKSKMMLNAEMAYNMRLNPQLLLRESDLEGRLQRKLLSWNECVGPFHLSWVDICLDELSMCKPSYKTVVLFLNVIKRSVNSICAAFGLKISMTREPIDVTTCMTGMHSIVLVVAEGNRGFLTGEDIMEKWHQVSDLGGALRELYAMTRLLMVEKVNKIISYARTEYQRDALEFLGSHFTLQLMNRDISLESTRSWIQETLDRYPDKKNTMCSAFISLVAYPPASIEMTPSTMLLDRPIMGEISTFFHQCVAYIAKVDGMEYENSLSQMQEVWFQICTGETLKHPSNTFSKILPDIEKYVNILCWVKRLNMSVHDGRYREIISEGRL